MPKAKQLSVWVEDRPGMLGKVASALGAKKVNIIGFMAPVADGRDAIRLVVDKPAAAKKALAEGGWETSEEDIIQIVLADKPGALGSAASKLGAAGINIRTASDSDAPRPARANNTSHVFESAHSSATGLDERERACLCRAIFWPT